jgi:thiosulfate dehydrogenase (quinone) large subunit
MLDSRSMIATTNSSFVDRWLAYGVFRFTLGINILIHGVGRLFGPGAGEFTAKTSSEFVGTPLPHSLVHAFLMVLPFAEAILGTLMSLGLLTRWTLTLGGLLITALVFGTALRSDWPTAGVQMVYAIIYYFLLRNLADNYFSVDTLLAGSRKPLALGATALSQERA